MRGILGAAGYIPYGRLDRTAISPLVGQGGGKGTRAIASYDEDTTTLGVEAARLALRTLAPATRIDLVTLSTVAPAYLDKTNAAALHAALRLDHNVPALDLGGAQRSAVGALMLALRAGGTALVVAADIRGGLPGSGDEAVMGDGAAAIVVGDGDAVIAEYLGGASLTDEFLDRWRTPGDTRSKFWEERFGETKYVPLGERAWREALKATDVDADRVAKVIVTGLHTRAVKAVANRLGTASEAAVDDLAATVGNTGAAHPALLLTNALEGAQPGDVIALVVLADGADVLLFRATDAIAQWRPARTVAAQAAAGATVPYGKYLAWRGLLPVEPPRRPEPARISASAAGRSEDWKFAFVGQRDPESGAPQLPPRPSGADAVPMADIAGTIVTFTFDRLAYSESPPIAFAVVDFDGGGRLPIELTDTAEPEIVVGARVEMTFRKLFTSDGIHNYFWKAKLIRGDQ
jgi:3-hydroxy-3-methylglutaryl CoA synthase